MREEAQATWRGPPEVPANRQQPPMTPSPVLEPLQLWPQTPQSREQPFLVRPVQIPDHGSLSLKKRFHPTTELGGKFLHRNGNWSLWPAFPPFHHSFIHSTISRFSLFTPSLSPLWSKQCPWRSPHWPPCIHPHALQSVPHTQPEGSIHQGAMSHRAQPAILAWHSYTLLAVLKLYPQGTLSSLSCSNSFNIIITSQWSFPNSSITSRSQDRIFSILSFSLINFP